MTRPMEQFAAKRKTDAEKMEALLTPLVRRAIDEYPARDWASDLAIDLSAAYRDTYTSEGGEGSPKGLSDFIASVTDALDKTNHPDADSVELIARWLATAVLNAATADAVSSDPEELVLVWTTMHDDKVRESHRNADGQRRSPGDAFEVDGEPLRFPGDPLGKPGNTLNCRCMAIPDQAQAGEESVAASGASITHEPPRVWDGKDQQKDPLGGGQMAEDTAVAAAIPWHGVLAPEGEWSGDGRMFEPGSLSYRDLPLPLTWQRASDDAHKGSVTVAKIDRIQRVQNEIRGSGTFIQNPEADEVVGLVGEFGKFGVSVDADDADYAFDEDTGRVSFSKGRICSASVVSIPAFAQAFISLGEPPEGFYDDEESLVAAGVSNKPWSDFTQADYTPEQWKAACVLHLSDSDSKDDHKLPIKEPSGALNRNGVHAAAARFNQTDAPDSAKASAKSALRGAYRTLGEAPPDVLAALDATTFGRGPGWATNPEDTERLTTGTLVAWPARLNPAVVPTRLGATAGCTTCGGSGTVMFETPDDGETWSLTSPVPPTTNAGPGTGPSTGMGTDASATEWRIAWFTSDEWARFQRGSHSITFAEDTTASTPYTSIPQLSRRTPVGDQVLTARCIDCAARDSMTSLTPLPGTSGTEAGVGPVSNASVATTGGPKRNVRLEFGRGPGWLTNPVETRRLWNYWVHGEGATQVAWGTPGDFNRCRTMVGEKIAENSPDDSRFLNQICAQWHHDATGFWPGHAPTEQAALPEFTGVNPAPALTLVAAGGPKPSMDWFVDPKFSAPQPFTITDDGRVFGHICEWGTCHIGYANQCVTPPRNSSGYPIFLHGYVSTDRGDVPTGPLTIGKGHAPDGLSARVAMEHYDSTSTAVCDVACGEDEFGIWVAGMVRPGTDQSQVIAMRASAPSGDWRKVRGQMEMVAAHSVNTPGFPVVRIGVRNAEQVSLVAAGIPRFEADPITLVADAVIAELDRRESHKRRVAALSARIGGE